MWFLLVVQAVFASTFTLGKAALQYVASDFFIGIRMSIAGLSLLAYWYLFRRKHTPKLTKNDLWALVGYGLLGITCSYLTEFWALAKPEMTSAKAGLLNNFSPFIAALVSYFYFSETITLRQWLALLLGFVGLLPIVLHSPSQAGEFIHVSIPDLVFLISVVTYALGWIFMRSLVQRGISPLFVNAWGMFIGGVLSIGVSYITGGIYSVSSWETVLSYAVIMVVIGNIICYNVFGYMLKYYTATFVTLSGLIVPICSAFYGRVFLGETVSWNFFVSLFILSFSLYLFYKDEIKQSFH